MNFNTKEINEIRYEIQYLKLLLECYSYDYVRYVSGTRMSDVEKSYWIIKDEIKHQQERLSKEIQKIKLNYD